MVLDGLLDIWRSIVFFILEDIFLVIVLSVVIIYLLFEFVFLYVWLLWKFILILVVNKCGIEFKFWIFFV